MKSKEIGCRTSLSQETLNENKKRKNAKLLCIFFVLILQIPLKLKNSIFIIKYVRCEKDFKMENYLPT